MDGSSILINITTIIIIVVTIITTVIVVIVNRYNVIHYRRVEGSFQWVTVGTFEQSKLHIDTNLVASPSPSSRWSLLSASPHWNHLQNHCLLHYNPHHIHHHHLRYILLMVKHRCLGLGWRQVWCLAPSAVRSALPAWPGSTRCGVWCLVFGHIWSYDAWCTEECPAGIARKYQLLGHMIMHGFNEMTGSDDMIIFENMMIWWLVNFQEGEGCCWNCRPCGEFQVRTVCVWWGIS